MKPIILLMSLILSGQLLAEEAYKAPKIKFKTKKVSKAKVKMKDPKLEEKEFKYQERLDKQRGLASDVDQNKDVDEDKVEYKPMENTKKKKFSKPRYWRYDR